MWASMVSLAQAVQRAVVETSGGTPEALEASHDLELVLQRHRNTFISLLRNPPKSANERWCIFVEFCWEASRYFTWGVILTRCNSTWVSFLTFPVKHTKQLFIDWHKFISDILWYICKTVFIWIKFWIRWCGFSFPQVHKMNWL